MTTMRPLFLIFAAALFLLIAPTANAKIQSVTLLVEGMTCPSCPYIVKKSLTRVDGVKSVKISLEERKAWVEFDDAETTLAKVMAATRDSGYPSELIK